LYNPDDKQIELLQGFNRIRNRMAHTLADLDDAVLRELSDDRDRPALERVQFAFYWLAFAELGAIQGLRRVDLERPIDRPDTADEP
jgi:hypothetical protein